MPEFSVVIPTFGRRELLAKAVASVLAQTVKDVECIVVDDGGTPAVDLPNLARLQVIRRNRNGGLSAARNTGIAAARGRAITFLDDDDVLVPDRLEIAREGLELAPVAICFRGDHPSGSVGRNRVLAGRVHDQIADEAVPHVGQACVERRAMPLFDETLRAGEEVDWWLRLTAENVVATVPRIGYLFRIHDGERTGNGDEVRAHARVQVLERHRDYFRAHRVADAFQWRRVGSLAARAGDRAMARRAYARSLARRPRPSVAWHLLRVSATRARS